VCGFLKHNFARNKVNSSSSPFDVPLRRKSIGGGFHLRTHAGRLGGHLWPITVADPRYCPTSQICVALRSYILIKGKLILRIVPPSLHYLLDRLVRAVGIHPEGRHVCSL